MYRLRNLTLRAHEILKHDISKRLQNKFKKNKKMCKYATATFLGMRLTSQCDERMNERPSIVISGDDRDPSSARRTSHVALKRIAHPAPNARVDWPPVAQRARCTIDYTSGSSTWCLPSTRPVCARPYALSRGWKGRRAPAVHSAHVIGALNGPIRIRPLRNSSDVDIRYLAETQKYVLRKYFRVDVINHWKQLNLW